MRVPAYATINTDANARIWLRWNKEFKTISAASQDFSEAAGTTVIVASDSRRIIKCDCHTDWRTI